MAIFQLVGWSNVWNDATTLVQNAWPEVTSTMRTYVSREINWANALSQQSLNTPFCIIHGIPFQANENWLMSLAVFESFLKFYYIIDTEQEDIQTFISNKMELMMQQLLYTKVPSFEVMNTFVMDDTEMNELNYFQLQADTPYFAGCIGASILIVQKG